MSTGTEKITINLPGMPNQEIKASLISIYDKINKPPTKEVGYDLFLKLIHKNIYSPPQMNFIINHVSEFILPLEPKEKDPCIKLLSLIFYSPSNEEESIEAKIYFPYLSPVLTTLQNLIKDSNSSIFPTISNIFGEIVQNIMPTDIEASNIELDQEEKTAYEMMQGFCIYNMKYDDKSNRIVGSLCLTKLVENCPIVLQKQYMKLIWEVIMNLIDKKNFNAKYELLNCLISLILGAENLFMPYAHNTLYKVLDFLADSDWFKRKLALNVIYTLIFYCKDEILPLKEHIISFLRALKTDKVKEVREVCLLILKIFSENEQKNKENTKEKNKVNTSLVNNTSKKKLLDKLNDNKSNNKIKKNINIGNNNTNNNKPKNSIQKKLGINKSNKNNNESNNNNKFGECIVPQMREKVFKENKLNDNLNKSQSNYLTETKKIESISEQENPININNFLTKKGGMSSTIKNSIKENNNELIQSAPIQSNQNTNTNTNTNTKLVNRKDDKTFINEKMVIKPDPNKSIFKSSPNPAFFSQANKKSKDIVLVSKGNPQQYKNNINNTSNINNNKNEEIVILVKEKNKTDINVELPEDKKSEEKIDNISINNKKTDTDEININLKNNKENKENKENNKEKINATNNQNKTSPPIKRNKFANKKISEKEKEKEEKDQEEKMVINTDIKNKENEEENIIILEKEKKEEKMIIQEKDKKEEKKEERKEEKKEEKKEKENEIKDYKTFLNKNEQKKKIVKKEKTKEKIKYDPNILNTLLIQMNSLSQKQLSLIDVMDNIQMETQGQIKQLNKRISKLEKNVEELNNELYYLKNE